MPQRRTKAEWIDHAFDALCDGGIDALRVEPLARRLGVTKGSFYHHFADRRALHLALLDSWEQLGTSAIIDAVEGRAADPRLRLRALLDVVFGPNPRSDAIESAIRAWAATDAVAAKATERVDGRRIDFVVEQLMATGMPRTLARRRAHLLYRTLIGEFIWRSTGGPVSSRRELDELAELLLTHERPDLARGPGAIETG